MLNNMWIKKNDVPLWTEQHLEHYKKYYHVYGLQLSPGQINQEAILLQQGFAGRRYPAETECYEIYTEGGELAGDISLTQENNTAEVSIVIFDQFAGLGLAKGALAQLTYLFKARFKKIEAVVKLTNPHKEAAQHILESAGFVFANKLPGGSLLFIIEFFKKGV